eukprot:CAMPEP_0195154118 /NCGR_PEP_ID=MMETSP0448-20130528/183489_1 /TAXON_ID=66468 /ORGANISM="Heterocapsa triquestra, Strain CCMP 448" /LENGTH=880 /DNA_ID=CAMNT_0040192889 /DNA_START=32 /DNA_END=2674 /DNA_ORIENTATION=-
MARRVNVVQVSQPWLYMAGQPGQPRPVAASAQWRFGRATPANPRATQPAQAAATSPPPQTALRKRRATVATASTEASRPAVAAASPPPRTTASGRRPSEPPRQRELVIEEPPPEEPPRPQELGGRAPAALPTAWTSVLELDPDMPALGGGAFAEVFKVRHCRTHQGYAVKVMHRPNFALRGIERQIDSEIDAMRAAAGVLNVVQLYDVAEEWEYVFMLMELCEEGDLLRKLHYEPTHRFDEEFGIMLAKQLLQGLCKVHSLGWLHRDIKPDNLLVNTAGVLKIADFGWCCPLEEQQTSLAGTFQYMAPEVLANAPQTAQIDVWSVGVSLFQILVGRPLLETYLGPGATQLTETDPHGSTAIRQQMLLEEIHATCPPSHERRPLDLSTTCWDFLCQLLLPEAEQRATVDMALQHPWLQGSVMPEEVQDGQNAVSSEPYVVISPTKAPEETGGALPEKVEPPQSPPRRRVKDARSPSAGRQSAADDSVRSVPTPLRPRQWDPARNIAYTPPMSPIDKEPSLEDLVAKENDCSGEKENGSPEISPERRDSVPDSKPVEAALSLVKPCTSPRSPKDKPASPAKVRVASPKPLQELPRNPAGHAQLARVTPPAPSPPPRSPLVSRLSPEGVEASPSPSPSPPPNRVRVRMVAPTSTAHLRSRADITSSVLRRMPALSTTVSTATVVSTCPPDRRSHFVWRTAPASRSEEDIPAVASSGSEVDMLAASAPALVGPQVGSQTPVMPVRSAIRILDSSLCLSAETLHSARGSENHKPAINTSTSTAAGKVGLAFAPTARVAAPVAQPAVAKNVVWRTSPSSYAISTGTPLRLRGNCPISQLVPPPPTSAPKVATNASPAGSAVWGSGGVHAGRARRATLPATVWAPQP